MTKRLPWPPSKRLSSGCAARCSRSVRQADFAGLKIRHYDLPARIERSGDVLHIVYLDQNKWIELARAAKNPTGHPDIHALLASITQAVRSGCLALPLAATNIYETHKINDIERRKELAAIQSKLSRGLVFRGRHKRLEAEVTNVLRDACGLPAEHRDSLWFLSDIFFEAFAESCDERLGTTVSQRVINFIRQRPGQFLYDYLTATPEHIRVASVRRFSEGSERLRKDIEERRRQHAGESLSMRRRIQSVILMINEIGLVITFANKCGLPWKTAADIGPTMMRRIANDVPTYHIERELALRLEAQSRAIEENDFRDMQTFCGVVPYAHSVIGENQFVNLAQQAKLDKRFGTQLSTNILSLKPSLERLNSSAA